jgi:hypothetical protein
MSRICLLRVPQSYNSGVLAGAQETVNECPRFRHY